MTKITDEKAINDLLLPDNSRLDDLINAMGNIFLDKGVRPPLPVMSTTIRAHLRLTILEWIRQQ